MEKSSTLESGFRQGKFLISKCLSSIEKGNNVLVPGQVNMASEQTDQIPLFSVLFLLYVTIEEYNIFF